MSPELSDLADLEWLLRDEPSPLSREAERAVGAEVLAGAGVDPAAARRHVDDDPEFRRRLALGWLTAVRRRGADLPGAWIGRGLSLAGWLLAVAGLVLGAGSASAFLAYDGTAPVNVLPFIAFFFLLQILLLVVLVAFVLRARRPGSAPGLLHRPIAWLAQRFGGKGHDLAVVLRTLHARAGLYADVERWTLFSLAQGFGLLFNVGAVLAALHAIVFSDLVFAWSTTLALEAETVHGLTRGLALPWSFLPQAVVDLEVVRASEWKRMPGEFVGGTTNAAAVGLAAEWWRFLVVGLVVYGLLPRLVAWSAGRWLAGRALRRAPFDHAGYQELFDRMLPAGSGWQGPDPRAVAGEAPAAGTAPAAPHAPIAPGATTAAIAWGSMARQRDGVAALIERRFGVTAREVVEAGTADLVTDEDAIRRASGHRAARVAFLAAAGHQPTGDVLAFLGRLRAAVGPTVPIVVGLVDFASDGELLDAEEDERAAWKRSLGALDDAYLWVEAMGAAT